MKSNYKSELNNIGAGSKLLYLAVGGVIGGAVALLFAPKAGSALRDDIATGARTGYDATLEKAREFKEMSTDLAETAKDKVSQLYDKAFEAVAKPESNSGPRKITDAAQGKPRPGESQTSSQPAV
ncbi:MAG: YtxH domain-containing protein [Pyrinomonadaceae bacterium]